MQIFLRAVLLLTCTFFTAKLCSQNIAYLNAQWWIKGKFVQTKVYSSSGKFSFREPAKIDSTIDLNGMFCIPPLGDAHTHNLDGAYNLQNMLNQYLSEGVLYVQVTGNHGSGAVQARPVIAKQNALEAVYANGLLTATYGHGFFPYEPLAMQIYSPQAQNKLADSIKKSRIAADDAYFHIDNENDLKNKWTKIISYKPDLIKICVLDAADYDAKRKAEIPGSYGLSPQIVYAAVKKAHGAGLKVIAHIETAEDARLCATAGVDGLAHLPGYAWNGSATTSKKFCLTAADAKIIKQSGMYVVPTLNLDYTNEYDSTGKKTEHPDRTAAALRYKKEAIALLLKEKVPLALGSDYFGKTISVELDYIIKNNLLEPATLLDVLCRQTAQHILPGRKIGEISEGYEASFVALPDNPAKNISIIRSKIGRLVKQGRTILVSK